MNCYVVAMVILKYYQIYLTTLTIHGKEATTVMRFLTTVFSYLIARYVAT